MKRKGPIDLPARSSSGAIGLSPCILYQFIPVQGNIFLSESSEFLCPVCQKGFLIFRDYCKRAIRATQKTILGSFGIDEADAKARALAIGKELMYAEEPEKEEDEYGTFWLEQEKHEKLAFYLTQLSLKLIVMACTRITDLVLEYNSYLLRMKKYIILNILLEIQEIICLRQSINLQIN